MATYDVVGFGIATTDHLGVLDRFPVEDTKQRMLQYTHQGGGTVGTPLVACARLGLRAAYLGRIGYGPASGFILNDFAREGVETRHVVREDDYEPPVGLILVNPSNRSRTICWFGDVSDGLSPERLSRPVIESSRVLYLDAHETKASVAAARWARDKGRTVVIDADQHNEGIERVLPCCGVIIGSAPFGKAFSGDDDGERAAHRLFEQFGGVCAITVGERGSYVVSDEGSFHQPSFAVEVVDTTGAGDVYHGAFVVGLLKGWPLRDVAAFASAVAAMKCRKLGGRAGIPRFDEAVTFLGERTVAGAWDR